MSWHAAGINVIYGRLGNRVGVVADIVFVMIAVFADVVGHDGAAILQMDRVRPRTGRRQRHSYKEDGDTQPHSGAF